MDICDDFLTSLPIEPGMLLSSDRMDFAIDDVASSCSSELLDDGYMSPPPKIHSHQKYPRTVKSELTSSSSSDESVDLNHFSDDFTTVNPDDFLTDFFKSEVKSESNPFSPKRDTPSPSGSDSTGSETMDYRIEMPNSDESFLHQNNIANDHLLFESPPISPPSPDGSSSSASSISSRTSSNIHLQRPVTTTGLQTVQGRPVNIVQGTLIPITTVPMNVSTVTSIANTNLPQTFKKIKIQPKPIGSSNIVSNSIKKSGQAKTIILSAQDYSALVQKCKSQQSTPGDAKPITIKASNIKNIVSPISQPVLPNHITSNIQPVIIDRSALVQTQPILMSGMISKAVPLVPQLNPVQIPATPIILHPRPVVPSSCVTAVRNVSPGSSQHQVRVAPRPAGSCVPPVEEKIAKKHQRMIKNRESACLSRKKKKDYMTSLETQLAQLTDTNQKLRAQNTYLRDRVAQLEKAVCQCGKAITNRLSKSTLLPVASVANKKNAMFLLAMVFMVSLNFGPFGNLLSPKMVGTEMANPSENPHHSRTLLWFDEDSSENSIDKNNSSKQSSNSSRTFGYSDTSQNSTNFVDTERSSSSNNGYPMCPVHVNQSESVRLAGELRRWIGDLPYYLNMNATEASSQPNQFDLNTISDYLLKDDTIKSLFRHLRGIEGNDNPAKAALDVNAPTQRQFAGRDRTSVSARHTSNQRIQVYDPIQRDALKYAELFEEIRRQDDTFYVVSFSGDHLLLPALAHNKSVRPKMSLMLPSVGINTTVDASQFVTLMQIDCEVINTSLIQIQSRLIPPHLRNKGRYSAGRSKSSNIKASTANRTATDFSKRTPSLRRPLQINQTSNQENVERGFNTTQNGGYGYEGNLNETSTYPLLFNGTDKTDFGYQPQPQNKPSHFKPYFVDEPKTVGKRKVRANGVGGV